MGLDITAYRGLSFIGQIPEDGTYDDATETALYPIADFPGRAGSITRGVYRFEGKSRCGGWSYSGYNDFRESLAKLSGWPTSPGEDRRHTHSQSAWNASGGPFWEIINFSDCEGVIGTEACAKLLRDFDAYADKAALHEDKWFRQCYQRLHRGVDMAADRGCLDFH